MEVRNVHVSSAKPKCIGQKYCSVGLKVKLKLVDQSHHTPMYKSVL